MGYVHLPVTCATCALTLGLPRPAKACLAPTTWHLHAGIWICLPQTAGQVVSASMPARVYSCTLIHPHASSDPRRYRLVRETPGGSTVPVSEHSLHRLRMESCIKVGEREEGQYAMQLG